MIERIPAGNREEWLRLRSRDVTASAAGALIGAHPFISPYDLHLIKAGKTRDDIEESPPMQRGRLLEPVAVALLKEKRPDWKIVHNTGAKQVYLRDPDIRLGATPDVFARSRKRGAGVVQLKSVEASVFREKWRTEDGEVEPPLWIVIQALVEAELAGAAWAAVGALVVSHGIDLHIEDIPLHAGALARIKEETGEFWRRIEAGEEPDPDYGRDGASIAGLYADKDNGQEIDLSDDNRLPALLEERAQAKARIKAEKARIEEIEAEVAHKVGPYERAFIGGWRVSRPIVTRSGGFTAPSSSRQLRIASGK